MDRNDQELINACRELGIDAEELIPQDAKHFINQVIEKFRPRKLSSHLSIGDHAMRFPLDPYEFTYSGKLPKGPARIFFDQDNNNRNRVVELKEGRKLCEALENAYGMEYFVSNPSLDFLISVNWYVIESTIPLDQ